MGGLSQQGSDLPTRGQTAALLSRKVGCGPATIRQKQAPTLAESRVPECHILAPRRVCQGMSLLPPHLGRHRATTAGLVSAALLVTLTGCSPGSPEPPKTPPGTVSPDASGTPTISEDAGTDSPSPDIYSVQKGATDKFGPLPLEAYMVTTTETYLLESTIDALTNQCMARFGFDPVMKTRPLEERIIIDREARNRLFGILDIAQAELTGYLPAWAVEANTSLPEKRGTTSAQEAVTVFVLTGVGDDQDAASADQTGADQTKSPGEIDGQPVPPNGCFGEARGKVYGTSTRAMHFVFAHDLAVAAWQEAQADPRVVKADEEWQKCMRDRGFTVGPLWGKENAARFLGLPEESRPSEEERKMAVSDIECKQAVNYASIYFDTLVERERQAIEDNQLALAEERTGIDKALDRANQLAKEA